MINHTSIGVTDIPRAKLFYDTALKPLGYKCLSEGDTSLGYGADQVEFWIGNAKRPVKRNPDGSAAIFSSNGYLSFRRLPLKWGGSRRGSGAPSLADLTY